MVGYYGVLDVSSGKVDVRGRSLSDPNIIYIVDAAASSLSNSLDLISSYQS